MFDPPTTVSDAEFVTKTSAATVADTVTIPTTRLGKVGSPVASSGQDTTRVAS